MKSISLSFLLIVYHNLIKVSIVLHDNVDLFQYKVSTRHKNDVQALEMFDGGIEDLSARGGVEEGG